MRGLEEWVMDRWLKVVAILPVYTAIVTTLTLLALLAVIMFA